MADIIKMNYQEMEEAAATYKQAALTIDEMTAEVKTIATMLEDGGLLGNGGSAFVDALNSNLVNALTRMNEKFVEVTGDLLGAMDDMQAADSDSTRYYN